MQKTRLNINKPMTLRLVSVLLAAVVGFYAPAAEVARHPGLVVGIVVEGLQSDYIDNLQAYFGKDGFNRLLNNGVYIVNGDYGTPLDPTAATAVVMTGAAPSVNGISGEYVYDVEAHRLVPSLEDQLAMGNFTSETYSPKALEVSTIADEIRIAGGGVANVYGVAPEPQQAILLGGHAANSALWINDHTGMWATTTFYKDPPSFLGGRNRLTPLSARIDTMTWTPMRKTLDYTGLPEYTRDFPFKYQFPRSTADRFAIFKRSALVNDEVTSFATEMIEKLKLGKHDSPDMLSVTYNVAPFEYSKSVDTRLEIVDSYLRLDQNLEQLFAAVDRAVGSNAVIFLAATPPSTTMRREDERWNIPYGEFSARKAGSLLNMYLMALYGNGDWICGFYDKQFYLNDKLIKERNLDVKAMRAEAASFVARMAGVKDAYTIDQVLDGTAGDNARAIKRNTVVNKAGDVFLTINPGWQVVNDYSDAALKRPATPVPMVEKVAESTAPFFILAPDIRPQVIQQPVDVRAVAPTVARLLRIRSPNAASKPALYLK